MSLALAIGSGCAAPSSAPSASRRNRCAARRGRGRARGCLSAEIQTSFGPAPVYSSIVHDSADPGTCNLRVAQIDIFSDQPLRTLASRINQSLARAGIPVEIEIDAFFRYPRLASALFPFMRGVAWYGGVRAAVPATRPIPFDRAGLAAVISSTPALCILVVRGSLQRSTAGEPRHLLVIGIGDVHDPEWISSSKARFRCNV